MVYGHATAIWQYLILYLYYIYICLLLMIYFQYQNAKGGMGEKNACSLILRENLQHLPFTSGFKNIN